MKKIKMSAAKLQLNKERIAALNESVSGQVLGGDAIYSVTSHCQYVCVNTVNAGWCVPETEQSQKAPFVPAPATIGLC